MTGPVSLISDLRETLRRVPILYRLLIGNSAIIVAHAVGVILLTGYVTGSNLRADIWFIGLFASFSVVVSILINYWIVRSALRPLHELRQTVDRMQIGGAGQRGPLTADADPDISRLAAAISGVLERLRERTGQMRALSERAITAQEEERRRIARALHDDTGQALSTLIINLERLESALPAGLPDLQRRLAATRQLATRTLEDLRAVVYHLRPTMLDDLGLVPAIRWYARSCLEEAGVQVIFGELDESTRLPSQLETALYRITQEAINNIVRHAAARSVTLRLVQDEGQVCLQVEDDGCGFDVARSSEQALQMRRFGLLGIQERLDLVSGTMRVDSAPGRGTRLHVHVPLAEMGNPRDG